MTRFTNFGSRGGPQGGSSQETPQYYGSCVSVSQSITLNYHTPSHMNISQYCSVSDASDPSPLQSPNVYNVSSVRPRDKKTRQEGTRPDQSQCSVSVRNIQMEWVRSWRSGGSNLTPTFNSPLQSCGHGLDLLAQKSNVQSQRISQKLTRTVALQRAQSAQEIMICSSW